MLVPLTINILMMLGLMAIATLKGKKATSIYHVAIVLLAFSNIVLYESSGYPYSIFFDLAMVFILIYEIREMGRVKKI